MTRRRFADLPLEPADSARAAGLRHVSDSAPGIRRHRRGRGFGYVGVDGRRVRDQRTLRRIRSLAIPPAWTDVWISPFAEGHLQATGRDARGRKQYRYHQRWRDVRDATKYHRMIAFAKALPAIRERTRADLARPGLARENVLAAVVRLLEATLIRVGNEEYARLNRSFGLTTMRGRHVRVAGSRIHFRFRGKGGREYRVGIRDRRLARVVARCQDLPGQVLFQYEDADGVARPVASDDVNDYLREVTGRDFTAKDVRTWAGTVLAYRALTEVGSFGSETEAARNVAAAIREVAGELGNTAAVCRRCYVHPAVIDAYLDGGPDPAAGPGRIAADPDVGLRPEEGAVVAVLEAGLADPAARAARPGLRLRGRRNGRPVGARSPVAPPGLRLESPTRTAGRRDGRPRTGPARATRR